MGCLMGCLQTFLLDSLPLAANRLKLCVLRARAGGWNVLAWPWSVHAEAAPPAGDDAHPTSTCRRHTVPPSHPIVVWLTARRPPQSMISQRTFTAVETACADSLSFTAANKECQAALLRASDEAGPYNNYNVQVRRYRYVCVCVCVWGACGLVRVCAFAGVRCACVVVSSVMRMLQQPRLANTPPASPSPRFDMQTAAQLVMQTLSPEFENNRTRAGRRWLGRPSRPSSAARASGVGPARTPPPPPQVLHAAWRTISLICPSLASRRTCGEAAQLRALTSRLRLRRVWEQPDRPSTGTRACPGELQMRRDGRVGGVSLTPSGAGWDSCDGVEGEAVGQARAGVEWVHPVVRGCAGGDAGDHRAVPGAANLPAPAPPLLLKRPPD